MNVSEKIVSTGIHVGGFGVMGAIIGIYSGWIGALAGMFLGYRAEQSLAAILAFGAGGWLVIIALFTVIGSIVGLIAATSHI